MKMKRKQKWICVAGAVAAVCTMVAVAYTGESDIQTQAEAVVKDCSLQTTYRKGETVAIDEAVLTYDGREYTSNGFVVTYPSRLSKSGASNYTLTEVGEYEVAYTYDSDVLKIKAVQTFDVLDGVYSFTAQGGLEYTQVLDGEADGLKLTYSAGDVFTYNQPIDLNATSRLGTVNILQECAAPKAAIVKATITDVYDSSKYVDIVLYYSEQYSHIYGRAGAYNQDQTACVAIAEGATLPYGKKDFYIDGQRYYTRVNTNGLELGVNNRFTFYYDDARGDVYIENMAKKTFITNVYNGDINAQIFDGFTTGEVLFTLTVEEFAASDAVVEIVELDGMVDRQLQDRLYVDTVQPKISVNCPTDKSLRIAKNESVSVFDYAVFDANYAGESQVVCYYNYGSTFQTQVAIIDGSFLPQSVGTYTLVYSAKDVYGNVGQTLISLKCIEADGLFSIQGELPTLYVGARNVLDYTYVGLNGEVSAEAVANNGRETVTIKNGVFQPAYVGEYTLMVRLTDGVFAQTKTLTLSVETTERRAFLETPIMPKYFVTGQQYSLPKLTAYEFSQGEPIAVETKCYIVEDGKPKRLVNREDCTIEALESVVIRYECADDETVFVESDAVRMVSLAGQDGIDIKSMFIGDFTSEYADGGVRYETNVSTGKARLEYVNPISLSNFRFALRIAEKDANFSKLKIRLVDYADATYCEEISFIREKGRLYVQTKDDKKEIAVQTFDALGRIVLQYKPTNALLYYTNADYVKLYSDFSQDKVYLEVEFTGLTAKTAFYAYEVNHQVLNNAGADYIAPTITARESSGLWSLGSKLKIYVPEASDELSAVLNGQIFVAVTGPDRKYVKSVDNVLLNGVNIWEEMEIELSAYGIYTVQYYAYDTAYNCGEYTYRIEVRDISAPSITLENGYFDGCKKAGKWGTTVRLASVTLSDDISNAENVKLHTFAYVGGHTVEVTDGKLALTKKGVYTVCYLAIDEAGNSTFVSYTIVCE